MLGFKEILRDSHLGMKVGDRTGQIRQSVDQQNAIVGGLAQSKAAVLMLLPHG